MAALVVAGCGSASSTSSETPPSTPSSVSPTPPSSSAPAQPPTTPALVATTAIPSTSEQLPVEALGDVVIRSAGLYPEGLAYDPVGDRFIVGSLWTGALLTVADDGTTQAFADSPGSSVTGLEVDAERNRLLVAVAGLPGGTAMLSIHDLTTGEQIDLVDFSDLSASGMLFANDVAVGDDGTAYVTNTDDGVIYSVSTDGVAGVLLDDDALDPVDTSSGGLNGIVYDSGVLLVGHGGTGQIHRIPLSDPSNWKVVETGVDDIVIDGMYLDADTETLAVVSNTGFVAQFQTADDWTSADEVARFETGPVFPTTVTQRDEIFYVLQAHLDRIPDQSVESFEIVAVTS